MFAKTLCEQYKIPVAQAFFARNQAEAKEIVNDKKIPFVIKNPLCSPNSPVHTIVSKTYEQTLKWLEYIDYSEGVYLQKYLGIQEAGHIALISNGEIYSLITNQEYKKAFTGNQGITAGAPLGGIIEQDPHDKYQLAQKLLYPLKPWFRKVNYHGPIQVSAMFDEGKWQVIEYNIRLGVTCGPVILKMLENPLEVMENTANNKALNINFNRDIQYGCSITLAGYGYPYLEVDPPKLPIHIVETLQPDVWWSEVEINKNKELFSTGHRLADIIGYGSSVEQAVANAYENIERIDCPGAYYRTDIGKTLWPIQ